MTEAQEMEFDSLLGDQIDALKEILTIHDRLIPEDAIGKAFTRGMLNAHVAMRKEFHRIIDSKS